MTKLSQKIQQFRKKIYQLLGAAKDATFELMDSVLLTKKPSSFAELSLSPVFRRKWSSLYEPVIKKKANRRKKATNSTA